MPSTDRKLELKAKTSMAQTGCVCQRVKSAVIKHPNLAAHQAGLVGIALRTNDVQCNTQVYTVKN
jgi:hypothetical protein